MAEINTSMNCGYGEKLILYFYGEAGPELEACVESHLKICAFCRAGLTALSAAEDWLKAGAAQPSSAAVETVMRQARSAAETLSALGGRGPLALSAAETLACRGPLALSAAEENTGRFSFNLAQALSAGALTAVLAAMFAFSVRGVNPELAWNSGLDSGLDAVDYSIYQALLEMDAYQADWEYNYSLLEAESSQALG
ncbi:MAG: hypothetical protein A2X34_08595 [Elusimicrobia bacterium GWC2_51_8]|nr:MAG: hypothetical protein A2X33_07940 [Elusimicrobia bacterium GWA2_51_34]OGR58115.1 MAG: hypothetical protein A2X34_08595 [Elusimicrobia bacterium GWC2_51_8]OGR87013.1 MAG: hypothetical protein A2021_04080 [Elusimicrobia bacterium GWF2_52_66]